MPPLRDQRGLPCHVLPFERPPRSTRTRTHKNVPRPQTRTERTSREVVLVVRLHGVLNRPMGVPFRHQTPPNNGNSDRLGNAIA